MIESVDDLKDVLDKDTFEVVKEVIENSINEGVEDKLASGDYHNEETESELESTIDEYKSDIKDAIKLIKELQTNMNELLSINKNIFLNYYFLKRIDEIIKTLKG